jgi:hypothetical protein
MITAQTGRPVYHPEVLLKIYISGDTTDVAARWLSGHRWDDNFLSADENRHYVGVLRWQPGLASHMIMRGKTTDTWTCRLQFDQAAIL